MKELTKNILELRNEGKSYGEIALELNVSKSNISYVFNKYFSKNKDLSQKNSLKERKTERNITQLQVGHRKYYETKRKESHQYWTEKLLLVEPLFLSYIYGLYLGEGNHSGTEFKFSNSNINIIKDWIKFLNKINAKFSSTLYLHNSCDLEQCEKFWKDNGIFLNYVTQYDNRKQKKKHLHKDTYYGTINIRVYQPLGLRSALIELAKKNLTTRRTFSKL